MTIYVTVSKTLKVDRWDYSYDDIDNMLWIERLPRELPQTTLQGAYNLIIDIDSSKIISYFETLPIAGPNCWKVAHSLQPPKADSGQLSLAHDIDDGQTQAYFTNSDYSIFYTRLGDSVDSAKLSHVAIGSQLIADVTQDGILAGVWMLDLPLEIGKKHIML